MNKTNTAEQRGMEMMRIPIHQLPWIAVEYSRDLASRIGLCGEVYLTAWTAYAQIVEGLTCTDTLYIVPESELVWWRKKGYKV